MTCIAGLVHKGKVYIGGDSAGTNGHVLTIRDDEKVFKNGDFIMGFTSSFRMGQLLRFKFSAPYHKPEIETYEYMVTDFIDAVRKCLKDGGYARTESGEEFGGTFLVGYRGELFIVEGDYQVGKPHSGFHAVGCGKDIARGSLYATREHQDPEFRIKESLAAAELFSGGVRGPFVMISN